MLVTSLIGYRWCFHKVVFILINLKTKGCVKIRFGAVLFYCPWDREVRIGQAHQNQNKQVETVTECGNRKALRLKAQGVY